MYDILFMLKVIKIGREIVMDKGKKLAEKVIANMAYETSKRSANSLCSFFFNQPKLPEKVKQLRKF